MLHLLVAEGNTAETRDRFSNDIGATPGESYAAVLRRHLPDARIDICTPADADARLPASLDRYDGVAITGSALNIHKRETASVRQIAFVQALFERGTPLFGSCWGLQLAAVAAGGDVATNPRGREVGFARTITLTEAGRAHPLHAGRDLAFDAPSIHSDEVVRLPPNATATAGNRVSTIQAAEIRAGHGVFWGVQYHPEYSLADVAATVRRHAQALLDEGFLDTADAVEHHAAAIAALGADAARRDLAWRLGLGPDVIDRGRRECEIANWITHQVRPTASARGRS